METINLKDLNNKVLIHLLTELEIAEKNGSIANDSFLRSYINTIPGNLALVQATVEIYKEAAERWKKLQQEDDKTSEETTDLEEIDPEKIPDNLEEAINILSKNTSESNKEYIKSNDEEKNVAESHHFAGRNIRNNWNLWWSKELAERYKNDDYPQQKPKIVEFFNELGIHHADDMSGIIITSFIRKIKGEDIKLQEQVDHYIQYWKDQEKE